jgi:phage terminase large subunit GpA-like protein
MQTFETNIRNILSSIHLVNEELTPVEWIAKNRYIQTHVSERMFGKFDWSNVPYMKEITNHLDPYSPVTHFVLMKGVRVGGTFALVHNGVPYIMSQRPTNIMLLSANDTLATKTMQGVDHGIDGCNIRHLLGKGSGIQNNSKGDTMESKHFAGGFELFNFGGQAASNMRQVTAGVTIADELDAFKGISKESGSFLKLMEDRSRSYGEMKKIGYLSSPLLLDSSLIYELFLRGDQRVYYVPCPSCGEFIELVWNERNENNTRYGVIFDVRNSEVIKSSVRYRCGKCENEFVENKKVKKELLNNGHWTPTIEREDKTFVSHRLSALYAPPTMDNWYDFAKEYQLAFPRDGIKDEPKFQSFRNSIEGLPYKPEGITIKSTKLQKNRREYKIGECPFELCKKDGNGEIMIITIACDLNGELNDARIDYQIKAYSEKGPSYSIDAGSVGTFLPVAEKKALEKEGVDVAKLNSTRVKLTYNHNVHNSVWNEFEEIVLQRFGKYEKRIDVVAVDVGYQTDLAMQFVDRIDKKGYLCLGIMGADESIFKSEGRVNIEKLYQIANTDEKMLLVNVNIIKNWLARYIEANQNINSAGILEQDTTFMNFPERHPNDVKYTYRNYFAHYESEHRIVKKREGAYDQVLWEKKKQGIQNHFWDVEIYNVFCKMYYIDIFLSNRNPFKVQQYGLKSVAKELINWKTTCQLIREASELNNVPLS